MNGASKNYFIGVLLVICMIHDAKAQVSADEWNTLFEENDPSPFDDWDPAEEMRSMQEKMNKIFGKNNWVQSGPGIPPSTKQKADGKISITKSETPSQYVITIVGGNDGSHQIDVSVKNGMLSISVTTATQNSSGQSVVQSSSSFTQAFSIPEDADPATVATRKEDNNLVITLDKIGHKTEETL